MENVGEWETGGKARQSLLNFMSLTNLRWRTEGIKAIGGEKRKEGVKSVVTKREESDKRYWRKDTDENS